MDILETNRESLQCSNCGINLKTENAIYKTSPDSYKAGFEFDKNITKKEFDEVFCTKCYHNLKEVNVIKSDKQPVIDTSNATR